MDIVAHNLDSCFIKLSFHKTQGIFNDMFYVIKFFLLFLLSGKTQEVLGNVLCLFRGFKNYLQSLFHLFWFGGGLSELCIPKDSCKKVIEFVGNACCKGSYCSKL